MTATHKIPGLVLTNHEFQVPLDYGKGNGKKITVFAREVVATENAGKKNMPWLVFFQGGPGFPSPRPGSRSGWLKRALKEFRVLLLDQRGTGLSSPVTYQSLAAIGSASQKADYLKHFRADSIVKDAEYIRKSLAGEGTPWTGLGQSYGGFCLTHYLSAAPEGLAGVLITGGLPPVGVDIDDVYRATYKRAAGKNRKYFERYPGDRGMVKKTVDYLSGNQVSLPAGGILSPERFQQLGFSFGMSDGFEPVHYLLESAFVNGGSDISFAFLKAFESSQAFETNPIYAILHEAIYCEQSASKWSAHRVRSEFPEFDARDDGGLYFTGEMIYPWMFEQYRYLEPLKETAEILAEYDAWPKLYNPQTLQSNEVPAAACVYYDDMYVETRFSEETAAGIKGIKVWVTNEYEHNGIRADGDKMLDRLLGMMRGEC